MRQSRTRDISSNYKRILQEATGSFVVYILLGKKQMLKMLKNGWKKLEIMLLKIFKLFWK